MFSAKHPASIQVAYDVDAEGNIIDISSSATPAGQKTITVSAVNPAAVSSQEGYDNVRIFVLAYLRRILGLRVDENSYKITVNYGVE